MAFFDDLGKKISQTGQDVVRKTKNFADTTKISAQIAEQERQLDKLYRQLGKHYYDKCKDAPEEDLRMFVDAITQSQEWIRQQQAQIEQIKGTVKCAVCGSDVPDSYLYCSVCGSTMPQRKPNSPPEMKTFCPNCGSEAIPGQRFCAKCGMPADKVTGREKTCATCGAKMDAAVTVCPDCGSEV